MEPGEPGVRPRCFLDLRHARGAGSGRPGSTDQPWPGSWSGLAAAVGDPLQRASQTLMQPMLSFARSPTYSVV
nr:hypothetical protein [Streptomyces prasinopilosus]